MRTGRRRLVPILLLAGWTGASAQGGTPPSPPSVAQGREASRQETGLPFLRNFSPKDYGAGKRNFAIVQDPRGVIYVGNDDGVLEFDGLRWRVIPTANKTTVFSLAVDATGRVYVGAKGEIGYLEPDAKGRTRYVSLLERIPPEARDFAYVWSTLATPEGIYFSSARRLFRLQGTDVQVWNPEKAFAFSGRVRERLFVREEERGLMEIVQGRLRLVPGGERFVDEPIFVMLPWEGAGSGENAPGAVLIGTRTQGFFVLDGASLRPFPTEADAGLKRDALYCAARMADGSVALGTITGGVYVVDARGRLLGRLNKARGLQDDAVHALFSDRQGGLWVALHRGIARVEAMSTLTRFDDAALPGRVMSLQRHRGRLYAGTWKGLFRLEPGPEPRFQPISGMHNFTLDVLSVGDALLVVNGEAVFEIRGDAAIPVWKGTPARAGVLHASRVGRGRVFVGLSDGLTSLRNERGRWVDEGRIPSVPDNVTELLEMPDGRLWVGTEATGVLRLSFPRDGQGGSAGPPRVERFGTADGLPSMNNYVRDVAPGMLRFAVRDTGIGMTPEQLGRMFQAFSQAEASTSKKFGGTGLGLVISLRFAQLVGGTITVESTAGEGTTFTAFIPMSIPDPRDEPAHAVAS